MLNRLIPMVCALMHTAWAQTPPHRAITPEQSALGEASRADHRQMLVQLKITALRAWGEDRVLDHFETELFRRNSAGPVENVAGDFGIMAGDLTFRQHSAGHTPGPNWPYFLDFAARYFAAGAGEK